MVSPAGRASLPVAVTALLAALSGCAEQKPCAGVEVESGIGVYFVQDGYDGLAGASAELCAGDECVRSVMKEEDVTKVVLGLPDDVDPDRIPVRFRVTRAGDREPFIDDSVDTKLRHTSDGCGGGAYNAGLGFTKEGGLVPTVTKEVADAWIRQVKERATASPDPTESP